MDDLFAYNRGKKLKCGYTTGSCAAGAAKASAIMLLSGKNPEHIEIDTPAGIKLRLVVSDHFRDENSASCAIIKDGGDDHDSTDGLKIFAEVRKRQDDEITIRGGEGIGQITRKGFWGDIGEPAINPVPRKMIHEELAKISNNGWDVLIYAPGGEKIAEKTLNSRLGIEGGISIIGTSGIVEPMSVDAMKKTVFLEIESLRDQKVDEILFFLGNYGQKVAEQMNLKAPSVKISNFIGDAFLFCKNQGFKKVTLIGHIGKLCKLSIGAFNTHSSVCDLRIEAFVYYLALAAADQKVISDMSRCSDSEEALRTLITNGYERIVESMRQGCVDRLKKYVKDPDFDVEIIIYSMEYGILDFS
ncbi:cobalt-precorrin-5B (C(1))-methyltransferase CbiD [bacterium]|nr:cobalt-precorrin-5B (C(1))-methyltransferase CbiD [bacterium]